MASAPTNVTACRGRDSNFTAAEACLMFGGRAVNYNSEIHAGPDCGHRIMEGNGSGSGYTHFWENWREFTYSGNGTL